MDHKFSHHPYIPNSDEAIKREMCDFVGISSVEELHRDVPDELRLHRSLDMPKAIRSEYELYRTVSGMLQKNETCEENINFLGSGCYQHYVPAICDEINSRAEILSAYAGEPYEDHGRFQLLFEYQSLMAELLDMEVVNVPAIDGAQAVATAIRMAERATGRKKAVVCENILPDKLAVIRNYCTPAMEIVVLPFERESGQFDLDSLKKLLGEDVAALYFETPSFLGTVAGNAREAAELCHACGALCIIGTDPAVLGVLEAPVNLGADIVCGDVQPLGMHMNYGGGQGGFIATMDDERLVREYPSRLFGITRTEVEGEYGFGDVYYDRTSFADREHGKEYVGTQAALWGITAGVYLSLMGPQGMQELGETMLYNARYAAKKLSCIGGVSVKYLDQCFVSEFVVDFSKTGKSVGEINDQLLSRHIFGGRDLGGLFPGMEGCALFCVTEVHTKDDIDALAGALCEILGKEGK